MADVDLNLCSQSSFCSFLLLRELQRLAIILLGALLSGRASQRYQQVALGEERSLLVFLNRDTFPTQKIHHLVLGEWGLH